MELLHRPVIPFDHHEIQKLIDRLPPKYRDWVGAWEKDDWSLAVGRWSPCRYAASGLTSFLGTSPEQAPCVPSASACEIDSELIAGRSAQWIHDGLCRVAVDALRQSAQVAQPCIEASSQTPEPHDSY